MTVKTAVQRQQVGENVHQGRPSAAWAAKQCWLSERGHLEGGDQDRGSECVRLEMRLETHKEMPGSNQMGGSQGER